MQSSEISPMQEYIVGSRGSTQYTQSWLLSEIKRIKLIRFTSLSPTALRDSIQYFKYFKKNNDKSTKSPTS